MSHEKYQSCIEECMKCAVECNHCATACLNEKEVSKLTRCIQLDRDCSLICLTAIDYMSRGSELAAYLCKVCADICNACAEECENHSHMSHCKDCAEQCKRCAEECRNMSSVAV